MLVGMENMGEQKGLIDLLFSFKMVGKVEECIRAEVKLCRGWSLVKIPLYEFKLE